MVTKTKIPWADYTINAIKGLCPMDCKDNLGKPYCYARKMYKRFKWNPEIRFDWSVANDLGKMKDGSKIFWGSTMELFGDWIQPEWMRLIFEATKRHSDLTHIFLTKQPQNLIKYSPFPKNCWVLVSATDQQQYLTGLKYLRGIEATIKGFSFEPLLHKINTSYDTLDWAIIGCRTQPTRYPPLEHVNQIIEDADYLKTPVFIKEPLASYMNIKRQEFPEVK
jgi:protein gp37